MNEPFTEEALKEAWRVFAGKRIEDGASEMEQLVLGRELQKSEDYKVLITLNSELESNILEKFEVDMLEFIRKTLRNSQISLLRTVKEDVTKPKLYTNSDKYDYLVKQNPKLKDLKDELGLDFEF